MGMVLPPPLYITITLLFRSNTLNKSLALYHERSPFAPLRFSSVAQDFVFANTFGESTGTGHPRVDDALQHNLSAYQCISQSLAEHTVGKASVVMDLMTLFSELMTAIIILVTRPLSLFKLACLFGVKTVFIVIHTWIELVRATFCFHVNLFSRIIMLTVALISLPVRILNALQRERQLELYLHDMQIELENLVWDRKELREDLETAIKERKMMELILAEVEEEHDKAIAKIEQLEGEFQDLKNENLRLKEIQDKGYWSIKGPDDMGNGQNTGIPYGISSWKSSYNGSGIFLQDTMMSKDTWGDESKTKREFLNFLKTGSKSSGPIRPLNPEIISRQLDMNEVLGQRREVALSQSLFSAVLSLLVGMIIWEAEDPCMPLVVALFTVVGMSLKSVVEFFSTIKNKPASDAVALLSFNWFILGMLTYPALPRVARMLVPLSLRLVDQLVSWLWSLFSLV